MTPPLLVDYRLEVLSERPDIDEHLSRCHAMIAELKISEKEGKGDKRGKP